MENSNTSYGEATFGYFIMFACTLFFDSVSDYTVWEAVYWVLGLAFVLCFLGYVGCWPEDTIKKEITDLELQIKKAELQKELARLSK